MDRTLRILRKFDHSGEFQADETLFRLCSKAIARQNREGKDGIHRGLQEKVNGSWVILDLVKEAKNV